MSQSNHGYIEQFIVSRFVSRYKEDSIMSPEFINIVMTNWKFYVGDTAEANAYLNLFKIKQAMLFDFPKFVPIYESETPMVLTLILQFYYFLKSQQEISKDEYYQVIELIQQLTVDSINNMSNDELWDDEKNLSYMAIILQLIMIII